MTHISDQLVGKQCSSCIYALYNPIQYATLVECSNPISNDYRHIVAQQHSCGWYKPKAD